MSLTVSESGRQRRPNEKKQTDISPWIPVSMLVVTTVALALPFALLRRQRASTSAFSRHISSSHSISPPPVRRPTSSRIASAQTPPASTAGTPSAKTGAPFRGSSEASDLESSPRVSREDGFNGVLYSLKAFSVATALVIAGGVASVWGVKAYFGVKDTQEFASAMRVTVLNKWPLLTSRIHRVSGDDTVQKPSLHPPPRPPTLESPDGPPPPASAVPDVIADESAWNWPEAQARLAAAYERGGVAQFAEATVGEMEAELEIERRKRGLGDSIEGQR